MVSSVPFAINITNDIEKWRWDTFWTKEPETIEFIDSFNKKIIAGSTFFDVGANIGLYSLYAAALYPRLKIVAIEPEYTNYRALLDNIEYNNYKNIIALNVAIGSEDGINYFGGKDAVAAGNSDYQLFRANQILPRFYDARLTVTFQTLFSVFKNADFIKIDTDGAEYDIIFGMRNIMDNIKMMLIEFDSMNNKYPTIRNYLSLMKFETNHPANTLPNHSSNRRRKNGIGHIKNIIFQKT